MYCAVLCCTVLDPRKKMIMTILVSIWFQQIFLLFCFFLFLVLGVLGVG